MNINDVIIKPIVTEKSSDGLMNNVYTLEVHPAATKTDVKTAVETIFSRSGAKVQKVNIIKVKRKPKTMGKFQGFTKGYKKAIITLSKGSIPIYGTDSVVDNEAQNKPKKGIKIIDTDKIMKEAEQDA